MCASVSAAFRALAMAPTFVLAGHYVKPSRDHSEIRGGRAARFISDKSTLPVVRDKLKNDRRIQLDVFTQQEYFEAQMGTGSAVKFLGFVIAAIMAIGSCFAVMNTMYAATAYRTREIATLRVLGFKKQTILASFMLESLVLALLGVVIFRSLNQDLGDGDQAAEFAQVVNVLGLSVLPFRHLFSQPPYATPAGSSIVEDLASVLASFGREVRREGMSFWTDAAILGSAGIPSVVFGPGGAGLHGLEEYVRTDEVVLCRDVLVETAIRYCAGHAG